MATSTYRQLFPWALMAILSSTGMVLAYGQAQLGHLELAQPSIDHSGSAVEPRLQAAEEANPFVDPIPAVSPEELPGVPPGELLPAAPPPIELAPDDYAGGWRQVGDGEEGLGSITRRHILFASADGTARGRISLINPVTHALVPASDTQLTFLTPEGATAFASVVETSGWFELRDVPEGVFAVVASGPNAFMAFAVQTIRVDGIPPSGDWTFDGAAVPPRDFPAVVALLSAFDAHDTRLPTLIEPPLEQIPADAGDRGGWNLSEGLDVDHLATPIRHHQVALQADGRLLGRLRKLHPVTGRPLIARELRVHAVRNGEFVESTQTSELGTFVLETLTPEVYSLIAEGPDGFIALAIDVLPADARIAEGPEDDEVVLVNPQLEIDAAAINSNLARQILQLSTQGTPNQAITACEAGCEFGCEMGCESGCGGGGSLGAGGSAGAAGGGGFGGGTGLLEALAIAGVVAAAAALADDDSSSQDPVSPSSF